MSPALENPFFQLTIPDSNELSWTLYSRLYSQAYLLNARMQVTYRPAHARKWSTHLFRNSSHSRTTAESLTGRLDQVVLIDQNSEQSLKFTLTFALPQQTPCLLWKVSIENISPTPVHIGKIELLRHNQTDLSSLKQPAPYRFGPASTATRNLAFFSNGWQSWNFTGVYGAGDRFRATRLGPFTSPMRVNAGRPRPKTPGHLVSEMFAVLGDRETRRGALLGFLSQQEHFGTVEAHLRGPNGGLRMWAAGDNARLDPAQQMTTDWAYLSFIDLDDPDPLGAYYETVAHQHGLSIRASDDQPGFVNGGWPPAPIGWCSWYHYFGKVTAEDIHTNLDAARQLADRLPLEVILVDDGFETKVGDWYSFQDSFPNGLAPLAEEIRSAGFTPGVWLAPFTVLPSSKVAEDHPDWLLRGRLNRPVNAGFSSWGEFSTALDLTHPDALNYAREVVLTAAQEWGFPYLKLDFLYAGALPGRHRDPTRTRAQILRHGLQALRDCLGKEITLLGCGCPLGSAIGLVDAMRIGADVSERWKPAYNGIEFFFEPEPDYPSTRNALQNILTRAGMHRRWWNNDPDCLLIRPDSRLTLAEIQTLATAIALSGGSFFISDDLSALPEDRIKLAASLLPLLPGRVQVLDWFDSTTPVHLRLDLHNQTGQWSLLALFNWLDEPADLTLDLAEFGLDPTQTYRMREYWSAGSYDWPPSQSDRLALKGIEPHGVRLLTVRPAEDGYPIYLGSNLHISQGLEVAFWDNTPGELTLQLARPGHCQGEIEIHLPGSPRLATLNGVAVTWKSGGENRTGDLFENRCLFQLDFNQTAELRVSY